MDIIDDLFIKRKVYISTVGWIAAIISGLIIYFSIFGIINILVFKQNPVFNELPISEHPEVAQNFMYVYFMVYIVYGLGILFGLFFLLSSIGLLKYREWGRKVFIVVSWLLIILSVLSITVYTIYSGQILTEILNDNIPTFGNQKMTGFMKTMLGLRFVSGGIILVVIIRALYQVTRRLRVHDYKGLFY